MDDGLKMECVRREWREKIERKGGCSMDVHRKSNRQYPSIRPRGRRLIHERRIPNVETRDLYAYAYRVSDEVEVDKATGTHIELPMKIIRLVLWHPRQRTCTQNKSTPTPNHESRITQKRKRKRKNAPSTLPSSHPPNTISPLPISCAPLPLPSPLPISSPPLSSVALIEFT